MVRFVKQVQNDIFSFRFNQFFYASAMTVYSPLPLWMRVGVKEITSLQDDVLNIEKYCFFIFLRLCYDNCRGVRE